MQPVAGFFVMNTYSESPSHLRTSLDVHGRLRLVRQFANIMESNGVYPDAIACCGVSGIVFATSLADRLQLPIVIVRKKDEVRHSHQNVEGPDKGEHPHMARKQYIFVDDLIVTGDTFLKVTDEIKKRYPEWHLMGILLYKEWLWGPERFIQRHQCLLITPDGVKNFTQQG